MKLKKLRIILGMRLHETPLVHLYRVFVVGRGGGGVRD